MAVGLTARSYGELSLAARKLAHSYLGKGDTFAVDAEATSGTAASDIAGIVTSAVLEGARGSRVSESPKVRFRAAIDGG